MVREMRDEARAGQGWKSGLLGGLHVRQWGRPGQGPQEPRRGQKQGRVKSERTQVDVRVLLGSTVTFYPGHAAATQGYQGWPGVWAGEREEGSLEPRPGLSAPVPLWILVLKDRKLFRLTGLGMHESKSMARTST